jgi:hypothetical protein
MTNIHEGRCNFYTEAPTQTLSFPELNFSSLLSPSFLPSSLSYTLEGLNKTQFYKDDTVVITTTGQTTTAEAYVSEFFLDWHYSNVGYDVMALLIFIVVLRSDRAIRSLNFIYSLYCHSLYLFTCLLIDSCSFLWVMYHLSR